MALIEKSQKFTRAKNREKNEVSYWRNFYKAQNTREKKEKVYEDCSGRYGQRSSYRQVPEGDLHASAEGRKQRFWNVEQGKIGR